MRPPPENWRLLVLWVPITVGSLLVAFYLGLVLAILFFMK